jgi:RNA polymerase sigma-70 factor (ECF subfamily)
MEQEERLKRVHQALDKLPEKQRTAFVLQKYEEMSTTEIASVMECSQAAVESLLSRAKKNLQKHLYECFNQQMTEGKQKN